MVQGRAPVGVNGMNVLRHRIQQRHQRRAPAGSRQVQQRLETIISAYYNKKHAGTQTLRPDWIVQQHCFWTGMSYSNPEHTAFKHTCLIFFYNGHMVAPLVHVIFQSFTHRISMPLSSCHCTTHLARSFEHCWRTTYNKIFTIPAKNRTYFIEATSKTFKYGKKNTANNNAYKRPSTRLFFDDTHTYTNHNNSQQTKKKYHTLNTCHA